MKHIDNIDKILPLSILVANLLLVANSISPLYFFKVFSIFLNSSTAIMVFIVLSIAILTLSILFLFIKKGVNFQKKYSVCVLVTLILIAAFTHFYLPTNDQYGKRNCNDERYYVMADSAYRPWYPTGYTSLAYSEDGIVFKNLGTASHDKVHSIKNGEVWYTINYDSVRSEKVRNKMKECSNNL